MKRKSGIPLVAIIIFFALIIGIIVTCVIILATQSGKGTSTNIKLSNTATNTSNDNEVMDNAIVREDVSDEGEEIDLTSPEVKNVFNLIGNQESFIKYAIYKTGEFNQNNISNELKLKLAISKVTDSEIKEDNNLRTISKGTVDKYLTEIFGNTNNIEYVDLKLFDDSNFDDQYPIDRYIYNKENEVYEIIEDDINVQEPSLVNELMTKAIKYNDRLELYVIPVFIKTFSIDDQNNMGYQFYSGYNFSNKEYNGEMLTGDNNVLAITSDTFKQAVLSNSDSDIDGYNNDALASTIKNFGSLQVYKYTFKFDENTEKYTLTSFEKSDEESNKSNNRNNTNNNNNTNNSNNSGEDNNTTDE